MSTIKTVNELPAVPAATQGLSPRDELDAAPKVRIIIHETGNKTERKRVYVGVNGVGYDIKRGEEVRVPSPVMLALKDAVQSVYAYDDDLGALMKRDAMAYPFTVVG